MAILSYCVKVYVQYISESQRTAAFSWPCEFTIVSLDIRMYVLLLIVVN